MPADPWKRFALPVSVVVIVAYWTTSTWIQLARSSAGTRPGSVGFIALFVCFKTAIVLAVVLALLRANGESLGSLGVTWLAFKGALVQGLLLAAGLFIFTNVVLVSALKALGAPSGGAALSALFRDPRQAPLWIFAAVVGGGFTEELLRAFVLTRFDRAFGRMGLAVALVVDSAVFGLGHLYQGVTGAIQSGVTGLLFALIFLKRRRAADAMVVHAIFDLLGIAAAYALYAGKSGRP